MFKTSKVNSFGIMDLFLPHDAMHRWYMPWPMCLSVCLSVRPSQVGVLLKRLNVVSHKQHHTIAQGLYFSEAKDLREIRPGSPLQERQMQVGWVKIGDFRQIAGYISKRYKIDAWFLLKSNRKSYALYQMVTLPMTWSDL